MLEVLVAATCTSLVSGIVLSLVVSSADATRRRIEGLSAITAADTAVAVLARDLRSLGRGVESAATFSLEGEPTALVSGSISSGLRLLLTSSPAAEVDSQLAAGRYRVSSGHGLAAGDTVVPIDAPGQPAGTPLPAGTVASVVAGSSFDSLQIDWGSGGAEALVSWGIPRALLRVRLREYQALRRGAWLELRRRDEGGSWQPVVVDLAELTVRFVLDTVGDTFPDSRVESLAATNASAVLYIAIEAQVATREGRRITAVEWVRG